MCSFIHQDWILFVEKCEIYELIEDPLIISNMVKNAEDDDAAHDYDDAKNTEHFNDGTTKDKSHLQTSYLNRSKLDSGQRSSSSNLCGKEHDDSEMLRFKVLDVSSEDPEHPVSRLQECFNNCDNDGSKKGDGILGSNRQVNKFMYMHSMSLTRNSFLISSDIAR